MHESNAPPSPETYRMTLRELHEVPPVLKQLVAHVKEHGFGERAVFGLRLSLEEVLTNAVRHGNGNDPSKEVRVEARIDERRAEIDEEDEGEGFHPDEVPDPTAEENLLRPHGRGVMLIQAYMTEVRYNDRGNRVTLVKDRACPRPHMDDD